MPYTNEHEQKVFLQAVLRLYKSLSLPYKVRQTLNRIINKFAFHKAQRIRAFSGSIDLSDFSIKATPALHQIPNFDKNWSTILSYIDDNLGLHERISHVIALPFFSLGGAQRVAFETAKALTSFPQHNVSLKIDPLIIEIIQVSKQGVKLVKITKF